MRDAHGLTLGDENVEWDALPRKEIPELIGLAGAHVTRELALPGINPLDAEFPHHQDLPAAGSCKKVAHGIENGMMPLGDYFDVVLHHQRPANHFQID